MKSAKMTNILDRIDKPSDLKNLTYSELEQLASEIRQELVSVVSANGGHLASNLGVVELTMALHRVFDTPRDKIIWDVGHQAYAHKLITGRRKEFASLRQYGGLSGFTSRDESEYDTFGAGHSSTSISAALGMAVSVIAADVNNKTRNALAAAIILAVGAIVYGIQRLAFRDRSRSAAPAPADRP